MTQTVAFVPLLPWPVVGGLAALSLAMVAVALWRGLPGWGLRLFAASVMIAALAGPVLRREDRAPVANIALVIVDESASNRIADRAAQVAAAEAVLRERLAGVPGLEVRVRRVSDAGAEGTALLRALAEAAAEVPQDRIAGAILLTDGQAHDADALAAFPAPVHVLLSGREGERDRRVAIEAAPAFAIVGETTQIALRIEDVGAEAAAGGRVPLEISVDGAAPLRFQVPLGERVMLPVTLQRGGVNVLQISTPEVEGELTARNNSAVVSISGVRDRLRVLLVSGEPYPGERTWRNLLKSDAAVDLVHFTILRPPDKQDFVPVHELSLIAFPTRELFVEKIDEFDLIIFDRYRRRGILPAFYFANIAQYVRDGGAMLFSTGAAFAGAESLYRTPLREVMPVRPSARVLTEGFRPAISAIGARHPVTAGLEGADEWGRWFRLIEVEALAGETVMTGPEGRPLLVLDRPGEGRVAVLASDQAWLWSRGFEGGGPQQELLRRLAHWLMKEPELEEEVLRAQGMGGEVVVTRRTLAERVEPVTATGPDGETQAVDMRETAPGLWQGRLPAGEDGVWRLENGGRTAVAVVGPAAPKEYANPVSSGAILAPLAEATHGGVRRLAGGVPQLRMVREDRVSAGRGWIGLADRRAYLLRDIREQALAPAWAFLALSAGLMIAAWRIEGR